MADESKELRKLMTSRGDLIAGLLSVLERKVGEAQRDLLERVLEEFVDKLELTDGGRVKNTLYNKRLLQNIDRVFSQFGKTMGVELATVIAQGVQQVVNFNGRYYKMFADKAQLLEILPSVTETVSGWLGIENGKVAKNGYLDTLIKDTTVKNQIKKIAMSSVVGQRGWMEAKKQVKEFVYGNKSQTGALDRYYRNFVYDLYSQVDRATSQVYSDKLGLEFFIYEGGIIATTRPFCKEKNGKVFHKSEIEKWDLTKAKPPGYNPFTDCGGYGCRHHLNPIPVSLAIRLRPDAKQFVKAAA